MKINKQKGSITIVLIIIVLLIIGIGSYVYLNNQKTLTVETTKNEVEIKNNAQNITSKTMKKFTGTYVSFLYPETWKVEEDPDYGYIWITNEDKDGNIDISYSIAKSKFDRDSKQEYRKFLLEYIPLLENIISEKKITFSSNLSGVGDEVVINTENDNSKVSMVLSVIHLKMPKPLNEYFDAIILSGYRAETFEGAKHFTDIELKEIQEFINSIEIIYSN